MRLADDAGDIPTVAAGDEHVLIGHNGRSEQ